MITLKDTLTLHRNYTHRFVNTLENCRGIAIFVRDPRLACFRWCEGTGINNNSTWKPFEVGSWSVDCLEEIQACFQLNADHPRGWRLGTVFSRLGSSEHKVHPRSGCKTE